VFIVFSSVKTFLNAKIAVVVLLMYCLSPQLLAQASGVLMYETGTPGVGLGSAGQAARAQDASTLYYNPAGMMVLNKSEYMVGAQAMVGYLKFQPGPNMSHVTGNDGTNPIGWLPSGSFYYVKEINSRTKVGFGTFSNFGAVVPELDNWSGRYTFQGGALIGLTFMPSIAHRLNEKWSIGLALNATQGLYRTKAAVNNGVLDPGTSDGSIEVNSNTWGFGANLGFLYQADKKTRVGLTYYSPVLLKFAATPSYNNLGPGLEAVLRARGLYDRQIDLSTTIPQQVMLGFYHEASPKLAIMGDVGWQNWSNFLFRQVMIDSTTPNNLYVERKGQDTWHAALGIQYTVAPKWMLSFGVGYDTSAFDDAQRSSFIQGGGSWRLGLGVTRQLNAGSKLNFGYEVLLADGVSLNNQYGNLAGRVDGSYGQGSAHFFTLNYQREF
jgi:long-chain fatty acid transport protein